MDTRRLFEEHPTSEIVEVSPKEREKILDKAEHFVTETFASTDQLKLNGGGLTAFDSAMARSLLELFVRSEASEKSKTPIVGISLETYQNALAHFKDFIQTTFHNNIKLLRDFWFSKVKLFVSEIFTKTESVFEPYVVGDLCEKLYLDNKLAEAVVEELKREDFIKVVNKKYDQNILAKTTII